MSECKGCKPVSTKVSAGMREYIDRRAEERGVSRSEYLRLVLDTFHDGRENGVSCPSCDQDMRVNV